MDLINQVFKTRAELYKKTAPAKSKETDGITLATIIEEKPKNSEVIKFFRIRADQLDGSS